MSLGAGHPLCVHLPICLPRLLQAADALSASFVRNSKHTSHLPRNHCTAGSGPELWQCSNSGHTPPLPPYTAGS